MPRIIFLRPAQTDHHLRGLVLGRCDPDLNESGLAQARAVADQLKMWPISFLGVSPLRRAVMTARCLERELEGVSVHPVAGFQGADMGDWENQSMETIARSDRRRYESWLKDPDFPAPGGESIREVYARAYPDLVNLVNQTRKEETLLLVLQEVVLKALCCAVLDLDLESAQRFQLGHGAFGIFERMYEGGPYRLTAWNCSHMPRSRELVTSEMDEALFEAG